MPLYGWGTSKGHIVIQSGLFKRPPLWLQRRTHSLPSSWLVAKALVWFQSVGDIWAVEVTLQEGQGRLSYLPRRRLLCGLRRTSNPVSDFSLDVDKRPFFSFILLRLQLMSCQCSRMLPHSGWAGSQEMQACVCPGTESRGKARKQMCSFYLSSACWREPLIS